MAQGSSWLREELVETELRCSDELRADRGRTREGWKLRLPQRLATWTSCLPLCKDPQLWAHLASFARKLTPVKQKSFLKNHIKAQRKRFNDFGLLQYQNNPVLKIICTNFEIIGNFILLWLNREWSQLGEVFQGPLNNHSAAVSGWKEFLAASPWWGRWRWSWGCPCSSWWTQPGSSRRWSHSLHPWVVIRLWHNMELDLLEKHRIEEEKI